MPHNTALTEHTVVVDALFDAIHVKLDGCNPQGRTLQWSDGITHECTAHYDDLSIALARLSSLMFYGETERAELELVTDIAEFTAAARAFLESATS